MCDTSQFPPDRLVQSITGFRVYLFVSLVSAKPQRDCATARSACTLVYYGTIHVSYGNQCA